MSTSISLELAEEDIKKLLESLEKIKGICIESGEVEEGMCPVEAECDYSLCRILGEIEQVLEELS